MPMSQKDNNFHKYLDAFYKNRYINIFLSLIVLAILIISIVRDGFYLILILSSINNIFYILGGIIYLNINYKLGCSIIIITFIIRSIFVFYIMPWNFHLLTYLILLSLTVYILYATLKQIKKE